MSSDEEARYNAEFARLMEQELRCPLCHGRPVKVTGVMPDESTVVVCVAGHLYAVAKEDNE